MKSIRRQTVTLGVGSILLCAFFGEHNASAETIWIEAATQIRLEADGLAGGRLNYGLYNDLNHGMPRESLQIRIWDAQENLVKDFSVPTDDDGIGNLELMLIPGNYRVEVSFGGHDGFLDSKESAVFTVKRCRCEGQLQFTSDIWPSGYPLAFEISRPPDECFHLDAEWMIVAESESQKVRMASGISKMSVQFELPARETGFVTVEANLNESVSFFPENLKHTVFLYDQLFDSIESWSEASSAWIRIKLSHDDEVFDGMPVMLSLSDGDRTLVFESESQGGVVLFGLGDDNHGCFDALVQRQDAWQEAGEKHWEICVPEIQFSRRRIHWIVLCGFGLLALLIAGGRLMHRSRRLPKLPDPQKWAANQRKTQVEEWPEGISENSDTNPQTCEIVCIDDNSGQIVVPGSVKIVVMQDKTEKPLSADKWPLQVPRNAGLTISHPDYVSWRGTIKTFGRHLIRLKTRRNFVIACFEAVCASLSGVPVKWGYKTPNELYEDVVVNGMIQNYPGLASYCRDIETAAFSGEPIDDEMIEKVIRQSRTISHKRRRG